MKTIIILLLTLNFAAQAQRSSQSFQEGTETRLTMEQRDSLKDWATNSLKALRDLLDSASQQPIPKQREDLMRGILEIAQRSSPKVNETLMRFTLNKAADLVEDLSASMQFNHRFVNDNAVRLMKGFIGLAEKYYESDAKLLDGKISTAEQRDLPYVDYALDVSKLLQTYAESTIDISAQYNVYIKLLGYFHVDLNRGPRTMLAMAPAITDVAKFLDRRDIPERADTDDPRYHEPMREIRKIFVRSYAFAKDTLEKNKRL